MADKKITSLEEDPGDSFVASVPSGDGTRERLYVDANLHSEELKRKVLASVRTKRRHRTGTFSKPVRDATPGLRIGYSFWGFLGDHKLSVDGERLSTPDGNATYSWSLVWEAVRRGHRVIPMMPDRDFPACTEYGQANFESFAQPLRISAYSHLVESSDIYHGFGNRLNDHLPELDVLLLEWRFPIPGRNVGVDPLDPRYQPDFDRQLQLLQHYSNDPKCQIIVWDLDLKLSLDDERSWPIRSVLETSIAPVRQSHPRIRVEPPMIPHTLLEHNTERATTLLSYIGSRYERDDVIDGWIRPIANRADGRGRIHFYGNWLKDLEELHIRWPGVVFHDRVTLSDFRKILRPSAGVPLLAKEEYRRRGFITPRVWEALAFGSIPIGLGGHLGVSLYTDWVAKDPEDLLRISKELMGLSKEDRDEVRRKAVEKISFMSAANFVTVLESSP